MRALAIATVFLFAPAAARAQTPPKPAAPAAQAPASQKPPVPTPPPAQKPATPPAPTAAPAQKPMPPAPPPGQSPVAPASAVKGPTPAPASPPKPEAYTYDPEGRRDPFITLVGTGTETGAVVKKGEGAAGMLVAEISVRGIMQSKGAYVAMVEGADKKTYIVHAGDRFADGTIKTIVPTGLIIIQEVNDPLSLVKQREIRKLLRSLEDAKE